MNFWAKRTYKVYKGKKNRLSSDFFFDSNTLRQKKMEYYI